ncbi:MAG TPA: S9 family peptidase [Bryobacteraceae bacterium]|nr:S9 family peptidase [Bryobacteraceae bacterium]
MRVFRLLPFFAAAVAFAQPARHPLTLDDLARFRDVRDPQCSPDGQWVAYTVTTTDVKEDKHDTDVWMIGIDGKRDLRMTSSPESESTPRWSPDGKYLAFLSARPGKTKGSQVWLLDRTGGEAEQLTDVKGRLQSYEWSPDSKRLALVIGDPDPEADVVEGAKPKPPKPIVIDRYHFKQDGAGYLLSGRHNYIYLFDIATKKLDRLTTQKKDDESSPIWSPDGARIAFISNHAADTDRDPGGQVYVAEAKAGSAEKQLTPLSMNAGRGRVEWSPDGQWIAFLAGESDKKFDSYGMERLALVASDGSAAPTLVKAAADLDRGVGSPHFSADGSSIAFLVTDDRNVYPATLALKGAAVKRAINGPIVVSSPTESKGCLAYLSGSDTAPTEVYLSEGGALHQLTHQNDALMATLEVAPTEEVSFKSKDGTEVHGLLTKPLTYTAGAKVPFLLRIHGGPNGQDAHTYSTERQFFAANGYAVMNVNYRGSAGRGQKFSRAIAADWGHYEVDDLEAGINYAIAGGVADPDRLGVGGWSYGAILTDYMIATDPRLKAATSGAGTAFTVAYYGTDQYIIQYDYEIGPPWKAFDTYMKMSYPFLHADRIKTPTLFLGGERDFNVPVQGGQQMYEALRSLGIDTQLIIYPNETHGIQRPSYQRDRMERYLAWYDKYLKRTAGAPTAAGAQR